MTIEEQLNQKKKELRSKISEARQAVIDKAENADDLLKEVREYEAEINKLEELRKATSKIKDPDDPDSDGPDSDQSDDDDGSDKNQKQGKDGKSVEKDPDSDEPDPDDSNSDKLDSDPKDPDKDKNKRSHAKVEETRNMPQPVNKSNKTEYRDLMNDFLHSKGEKRDGIKTADVGAIIPEEIVYNPEAAVETVTDLGKLITKTAVTTLKGTYPIMKRASQTLSTVAELEKNPELAKPEFTNIDWVVDTYRGFIPVSQESIADTQIDLVSLVANWIQQVKTNTTNEKVAAVLSSFTHKSITDEGALIDDLKTVKNTQFDPAYNLSWVVTASAYNALDLLKDSIGRPLLQEQIGTATGTSLFGKPLTVVEDTAFGGKDGDKQFFIGDLPRAVLFANRVDAAVRWVDDNVYGQLLQGVVRFGVSKADENAGIFITADYANPAA
jgi:HK97 family phage major capsid protein